MDAELAVANFADLATAAGNFLIAESPSFASESRREGIDPHQVADMFCRRAVRYMNRRKPRSDFDRERMRARLLPKVRQDLVCGFVVVTLLIESLISWAFQKLFDWLWGKWWIRDHSAQVAVVGMAAEVFDPSDDGPNE